MRSIDDLATRIIIGAMLVLALGQLLAGCTRHADPGPIGLALPRPSLDAFALSLPPPPPNTTAPTRRLDPRVGWCEPIDLPLCREHSDCAADSHCVRPWWAETDEAKVCARRNPDRDERRWRSDRLRVFVDHVCRRAAGCEPNDMHAYLRVLALRESTWRPYKRHRLNPDLEANAEAWAESGERFAGNPAQDPARWSTGLGYYGQIPALALPLWDRLAPPETLCGEVESSEVHLRAARSAVRKIRRGVDCDKDGERDFFGTACVDGEPCEPSWYDASRVNSGSLCPGDREHRERFEKRARSVGLDAWAPVGSGLGRALPVEEQDAIAEQLRARMESVAR